MTGSVGISGSLSVNGISTLTGALSGTSATFSSTLDVTNTIRTDGASNSILLRNGYTATIKNPNNNTRDLQIEGDGVTATFKGDGKVGIGTTSPSSKLHVFSANGTTYASTAQLRVDGGGVNNNYAQIIFSDSALSDGKISYYPASAAADRFFSISARTTESDFVIRGDGKVGIGTSSPTNPLHILSNTVSQLNVAALSGNTNAQINLEPIGTGIAIIGPGNSVDFVLRTNATERMRITSGGDVGIGTTSPSSIFDITGASANGIGQTIRNTQAGVAATASFRMGNNLAVNRFEIFTLSSTYTTAGVYVADGSSITNEGTGGLSIGATNAAGILRFYTAGSGSANEKMRITSAGNVGIGTTSPDSYSDPANNLVVGTTSGNNGITIAAATTGLSSIYFADGTTGNEAYRGYLEYGHTNDYLAFGTAASERMRITSGGNVEIKSAGKLIAYRSDNTRYGEFFTDNNAVQITSSTDPIRISSADRIDFYAAGSERMRITSGGDVLVSKTAANLAVLGCELRANGRIASVMAESTNAMDTLDVYSTGASAYRFYVQMDGKVNATNTTIAAISDIRLKENIQDIDVGLKAILSLKPRKFDWKDGKGKNIKEDRGWIAQEFEEVFPEMIGIWKDTPPEGEEPYKSVAADLIPILVKAIQEQQSQIEALKLLIK